MSVWWNIQISLLGSVPFGKGIPFSAFSTPTVPVSEGQRNTDAHSTWHRTHCPGRREVSALGDAIQPERIQPGIQVSRDRWVLRLHSVCIVSGENYLVPGTFRAALAAGAEVSESTPEETLWLCTEIRVCSHDFAAGTGPVLQIFLSASPYATFQRVTRSHIVYCMTVGWGGWLHHFAVLKQENGPRIPSA